MELDQEGLQAAVNQLISYRERGEILLKDYGVGQIIEAYENGKKLHLARTTLQEESAADVLGEHLVILKNHYVHVTKTIRALHEAGYKLVKE